MKANSEVAMIQIYGSGPSRWVRPVWTARELGLESKLVPVHVMSGETQTPAYRAINPFGRVPSMADHGFALFESVAICTHLAEKKPAALMVPKAATNERALYDQWNCFVISTLEQPLERILRNRLLYPPERRCEADIVNAEDDFRRVAEPLDNMIEDHLVGGRFTVADIIMAYALRWSTSERLMGKSLLVDFPRLQRYLELHTARPTFPKELYE
jgi:glutathione S-transferase